MIQSSCFVYWVSCVIFDYSSSLSKSKFLHKITFKKLNVRANSWWISTVGSNLITLYYGIHSTGNLNLNLKILNTKINTAFQKLCYFCKRPKISLRNSVRNRKNCCYIQAILPKLFDCHNKEDNIHTDCRMLIDAYCPF